MGVRKVELANDDAMKKIVELIMNCGEGATYAADQFEGALAKNKLSGEFDGMLGRLKTLATEVNLQLATAAKIWEGQMPAGDRLINMHEHLANKAAVALQISFPMGIDLRLDSAYGSSGDFLRNFSMGEQATPLEKAEFASFSQLFAAWLVKNDLLSKEGKLSIRGTDKPMTKEQFYALLNDPNDGFEAMVKSHVSKVCSVVSHVHRHPNEAAKVANVQATEAVRKRAEDAAQPSLDSVQAAKAEMESTADPIDKLGEGEAVEREKSNDNSENVAAPANI